MTRAVLALVVVVAAVGCGGKDDEPSALDAIGAAAKVAAAAPKMEAAMASADELRQERVAKGDTIAMPYAQLHEFQPTEIDGYTREGDPSGSQQAMPGFSMSQSEQRWVGAAGGDGVTPEVMVTLTDFGGTELGYAMMAAPMLMGFSREDDRQRVGSTAIDVPQASGWEEYDKQTRDAKVTAVARYRYVITVEARNQTEDQTEMVRRLATEIARKFEGK